MSVETFPREGMMAVVRNRRALITGVLPCEPTDQNPRLHLVEVEYTDGLGAEADQILWEVEAGTELLEPSALPRVDSAAPMEAHEFDAMIRAARWSALTPSLPFSGLTEDRPPLAAPLFGAIHPEAYQLVPVLRALEMPRVALMLADAVGLGKTIQAGMILRELMLRRRIRRVLILCPASLRTQWRDELNEKFSLPFDLVDRPHTLRLQRELGLDANPWRVHEHVIASYHYLKQPDVLEQFRSTAEPGKDGLLRWDLLIVDEAHNLAPSSFGDDSDLSRMLQQISPWFEHRVFLSATPHNGHTRSFSGLLEALDPVRFTRKSELEEEDRNRVAESVIRRLKSEINKSYVAMGEPARFSDRDVDALPVLRFGAQERALSDAFHDFRKALFKVTARAGHSERAAARFAIEVLQKRLLSGPWAFGQSWLALREGLEVAAMGTESLARVRALQSDDTDNDPERESRQRQADRTVGAWLRDRREMLAAEIAAVTHALDALGLIRITPGLDPNEHQNVVGQAAAKVRADARFRALEALIEERLRDGHAWRNDERLVIFTEYLATLDYLVARLRARFGEGDWLLSLYGGMSDEERDGVKRAFNDRASAARILVATDAAGEGLNLQRSCRLLLHWDIPWNPGKMEQRNGRLDRHGQERDVLIFHFDSTDDASMRFLGKVLKKRSQTREDRVVTDEIFAHALLAHFEQDEDADAAEERLERNIKNARSAQREVVADVPDGAPLPGQQDRERLDALRKELDLSPESLRDTLETTLGIDDGHPRLKPDEQGRDRFVHPVPELWRELVDHTLRDGGPRGQMLALVFDPAHYVQMRSGRPVFLPENDSRLLHLGHALYHRVMSTFARYRFPGGPKAATRWTARQGGVPSGVDALILLTVEELAVNELREPCHHWVRTVALPIRSGKLGDPVQHQPPECWQPESLVADVEQARALWDEVEGDLKQFVQRLQQQRSQELLLRLEAAGRVVAGAEKERFKRRRDELKKAMQSNSLEKIEREVSVMLERRQQFLFSEMDEEERRKLSDKQSELELRKRHYETVLHRLADEETRTLERVLPLRYRQRGEARVYPIAVEIRLPCAKRERGAA